MRGAALGMGQRSRASVAEACGHARARCARTCGGYGGWWRVAGGWWWWWVGSPRPAPAARPGPAMGAAQGTGPSLRSAGSSKTTQRPPALPLLPRRRKPRGSSARRRAAPGSWRSCAGLQYVAPSGGAQGRGGEELGVERVWRGRRRGVPVLVPLPAATWAPMPPRRRLPAPPSPCAPLQLRPRTPFPSLPAWLLAQVLNPCLILGPMLPGQPHLNTSSNALATWGAGPQRRRRRLRLRPWPRAPRILESSAPALRPSYY